MRVLPSSVPKKRSPEVGVAVNAREDAGSVGDRAAAGEVDGIAGVAFDFAFVVGKGRIGSGAGVVARVAPAMSAVVIDAKCPGIKPPVLQSR